MKIYTAGYPRSGNTWLGWLLADCLDSHWNSSGNLLKTGLSVDGGHQVVKTHAIETPGPTVFICRDPRDVAVSMMKYRCKNSIAETIRAMGAGTDSNPDFGRYEFFIRSWLGTGKATADVRYEDLKTKPGIELVRICTALGLPITEEKALAAANRQTIANAQKLTGDKHTYRRGEAGKWREYFTHEDAELFQKLLGAALIFSGYETGPEWVEGVE